MGRDSYDTTQIDLLITITEWYDQVISTIARVD
jgi:hypothetical protein